MIITSNNIRTLYELFPFEGANDITALMTSEFNIEYVEEGNGLRLNLKKDDSLHTVFFLGATRFDLWNIYHRV